MAALGVQITCLTIVLEKCTIGLLFEIIICENRLPHCDKIVPLCVPSGRYVIAHIQTIPLGIKSLTVAWCEWRTIFFGKIINEEGTAAQDVV